MSRLITYCLMVATFVLLIFVFVSQLHNVITEPVFYDDAYNASVAKNVAMGYGYATSYNGMQRFNPEVTTGPAMLIPAAIAIKAFGNQAWVSHLSASLISFFLWVLLLVLVGQLGLNKRRTWLLRFLMSFLLIGYSFVNRYGQHCSWCHLLGEVMAALLVANAIVLLFVNDRFKLSTTFASGLFFGLAYLTKALVVLYTSVFLLLLAYRFFVVQKGGAVLSRLLMIVAFLCGALFLPLSVEGYKRASSSPEEYRELKAWERQFFKVGGSGIAEFEDSSDRFALFQDNYSQNIPRLRDYFNGWAYLGIFVLFVMLLLYFSRGLDAVHMMSYGFICCFGIHFGWWLLFSTQHWIRHLEPGLVGLFIGVALLFSVLKERTQMLILALLLMCACIPLYARFVAIVPTSWEKSSRLIALENTADYLSGISDQAVLMGAGWWANRDLEYLLPSVGNFMNYDHRHDWLRHIPQNKRIYLVRSSYWNVERNSEYTRLASDTDDAVVFFDTPFKVSLCSDQLR